MFSQVGVAITSKSSHSDNSNSNTLPPYRVLDPRSYTCCPPLAPLSNWFQKKVVGAISLGALISGDQEAAHAYYLSLRYHLGDVNSLTGVGVVPSLALVALYWQHQGEDELKIEWVGHARRVLANVQVSGCKGGRRCGR